MPCAKFHCPVDGALRQVVCISPQDPRQQWDPREYTPRILGEPQIGLVVLYRDLQLPREEGTQSRSAGSPATTNQKAMQKATRTKALYQTLASVKPKVPSIYCDTVMSCPSTLITVCSSFSWLPITPFSVHAAAHSTATSAPGIRGASY